MKYLILLLLLCMVSCSDYGRRLEFINGEVFYTKEVKYNVALETGKLLMKDNMYFDGRPKSVQIDKKDGRYIFRVVEPEEKYTTQPYENLAFLISTKIVNEPVDVEICDRQFRTLRRIPFNENIAN